MPNSKVLETYGADRYVPALTVRGPNWRDLSDRLEYRDLRVLTNESLFEVMEPKRKTIQANKDFINDQDSISGPGVIDNMIRNILTIRSGTLSPATRFGIAVDSMLFEQLDWANLEFMRTVIFSNLNNQLPGNITVTHLELSTDDEWTTLYISVAYNIRLKEGEVTSQQPGPDTIGGRVAYVSLNLAGVRGSNSRNFRGSHSV